MANPSSVSVSVHGEAPVVVGAWMRLPVQQRRWQQCPICPAHAICRHPAEHPTHALCAACFMPGIAPPHPHPHPPPPSSLHPSPPAGSASQIPFQRYSIAAEDGSPVFVDPALFGLAVRLPLKDCLQQGIG